MIRRLGLRLVPLRLVPLILVPPIHRLLILAPLLLALARPAWAEAPLQATAFGARCDGQHDDTAALTAWAAAITADRAAELPGGHCLFRQPLTLPVVNHVVIRGQGTSLIYQGALTDHDLIRLGQGGTGNCQALDWVFEDLRIASETTLTGGAGLYLGDLCESELRNLTLDGDLAGNGRLWNGVHFDGGNSVHYRGVNVRAANIGVLVNGDPSNQFTDLFIGGGGKITHSRVGLNAAGNVGGLFISGGLDLLENEVNLRIDQSRTAIANSQVFLDSSTAIDVTSGGHNRGLELLDPGGGNSILLLDGTWIASAGAECLYLPAHVRWQVQMTGGTIYNCQGDGLYSASTEASITLTGTLIANNKGYGINNHGRGIGRCGVTFRGNRRGESSGPVGSSC